MALKTIRTVRRRLADDVYDQLVQAIQSGDIGLSDRLVQEKLATELQISRTPVREALMRLEQEGVLEVAQNGSFKLYRMSDAEVRELYQSRAAIEGQCARILAARQDPDDLAALRATVNGEERNGLATARDYFEANRNIHRAFVERARNRFLLEMFDLIWGKASAFQLFAMIENVDLAQSLGEHMTLVDVIATGDKTETLEVFTKHIEVGFELQMAGIKSVAS